MIKMIIQYIKDHLKLIVVGIFCYIILYVMFSLYHVSVEIVVYSMYLTLLFIGIVCLFDFKKYYYKHKELSNMIQEPWYYECSMKEENMIEEDYRKILNSYSQELQFQKNELENTKREMDDYYSLWVHQMKLPIAAIKLLIDTQEDVDKRLIKSELFRIEQYADMVLTYLRMDQDYQIKKYPLDAILREAIRKFSNEFIRKKIKLEYQGCNEIILTDEKWLTFIIEQLLSNALKYTEQGKISIYMKDKDILIIEDTGIGIEQEDLPRIFEKGYTGFNGRYDKKASGIGLYLCKRIADNLSHKLEIQSQKNVGTKAILYLDHYDLKVE